MLSEVALEMKPLQSVFEISANEVKQLDRRLMLELTRSHFRDAYEGILSMLVPVDQAAEREFNFCAPLTWWDAFKERWFPKWALRRWPVRWRYRRISFSVAYPDFRALPHETFGQAKIVIFDVSWPGSGSENEDDG